MSDILSVEVGDQFENKGTGSKVEVVKIWFAYSQEDQRWETSVTWNSQNAHNTGKLQLSGKGREFVVLLRDCEFVRVSKTETSPSNGATVTPPTTPGVNPKHQQWENDFRVFATKYGLQPSDLGRKVWLDRNRRKDYVIIGAKPRNYKMPILVRGKRGGIYKITAERAKKGLV